MRVLICPDRFGGNTAAGMLSAVEAAAAIEAGWRAGAPLDEPISLPLSDGGPGLVEVLAQTVPGQRFPVPTVDPLGRRVPAEILLAGDTAYVDSAQACGRQLLSGPERNPKITTSYGLGVLLATAVEAGARRVVIGLEGSADTDGSATNDGGAGMLAALGAAPLDEAGLALPYGGAALIACAALSGSPRLRPGVDLVAATEVGHPLTGPRGASYLDGPRKGAAPGDVPLLDAALERFSVVLEKSLATCPNDLAVRPGTGSAGGVGAAIVALGGRIQSGVGLVGSAVGLDSALDAADLVITGAGSFDGQSIRGSVVARVAGAARDRGIPCVVVAGRVSVSRRAAAIAGSHRGPRTVRPDGRGGRADRPAGGRATPACPAPSGGNAAGPVTQSGMPSGGTALPRVDPCTQRRGAQIS